MNPKVCECKQLCRPLVTYHNPQASEWYCDKCHKSYRMSAEEYNYWAPRMQQQKPN